MNPVQDVLEDVEKITNDMIYDISINTQLMIIDVLNSFRNEKNKLEYKKLENPQNVDLYRLQINTKDMVHELKTSVTKLQNELQMLQNKALSRQISEGSVIPEHVTKFHLQKAKREEIELLLKDRKKKYLGHGTFGVVYKVRYKGQNVALKHINKQSKKGKSNSNFSKFR